MSNIINPDFVCVDPYSSERSLDDISYEEATRVGQWLEKEGFFQVARVGNIALEGTTVSEAISDGTYVLPDDVDEDKLKVGPDQGGDGTINASGIAFYAKSSRQ